MSAPSSSPSRLRRLAGWYERGVGLLLAFVLLASSLPHLANPYYLLSSVFRYELVGFGLGHFTAMTLPFVQLVVGLCLVGRVLVGGALLASTGLFAVFTFVHASAVFRRMSIPCGCFGPSESFVVGWYSLFLVGLLLAAALSASVCFVVSQAGQARAAPDPPAPE